MDVHNLVQVLQGAIGPLILISGAGLLLLSMTNRLARPIDRIRQLLGELPGAPEEERPFIEGQIEIFARRCGLLRKAIAWAIASIFCIGAVVLLLFAHLLFPLGGVVLIQVLFTASVLCLLAASAFFFLDVRLTLRTLGLEVERRLGKGSKPRGLE